MPDAILITECLQNDFVLPPAEGRPLPNMLHVGREEALRLMGPRPGDGPVDRMMAWAYEQPREKLAIIHLRDWHEANNNYQKSHLDQFGPHCLAGSDGAAFAFVQPDRIPNRAHVVDALTLNDFHRTGLADLLAPWTSDAVSVGLMGVWTEAKITFLAYELATRYPNWRLGVCSALTASSSRARHFLALDQLERILGVAVYSSIGEFVNFLGDRNYALPPSAFNTRYPVVEFRDGTRLDPVDQTLLRYLFRDCRKVEFTTIDGGFSGNVVLGGLGEDLHGHHQVPHVIKIGPQNLIGRERAAFEQIEQVLGNHAPNIDDFADYGGRGGLKYRYASMGAGQDAATFQKFYTSGLPLERIESVLGEVFEVQLGRLYGAAMAENVDLLDYYGFSSRWAGNVRSRVAALDPGQAQHQTITFPSGRTKTNICRFYERTLPRTAHQPRSAHYFSFVHGDLNGANIIIDSRENVWLIDFFHTHHGHVLRDLLKLENDLLYIFTPLGGSDDLEKAMRLTDMLLGVHDLSQPLPAAEFDHPDLNRAWRVIQILRGFYPGLVREYSAPWQAHVGALRYAVHTLSFDESNEWQKKWALYSACGLAEKITETLALQSGLTNVSEVIVGDSQ